MLGGLDLKGFVHISIRTEWGARRKKIGAGVSCQKNHLQIMIESCKETSQLSVDSFMAS